MAFPKDRLLRVFPLAPAAAVPGGDKSETWGLGTQRFPTYVDGAPVPAAGYSTGKGRSQRPLCETLTTVTSRLNDWKDRHVGLPFEMARKLHRVQNVVMRLLTAASTLHHITPVLRSQSSSVPNSRSWVGRFGGRNI